MAEAEAAVEVLELVAVTSPLGEASAISVGASGPGVFRLVVSEVACVLVGIKVGMEMLPNKVGLKRIAPPSSPTQSSRGRPNNHHGGRPAFFRVVCPLVVGGARRVVESASLTDARAGPLERSAIIWAGASRSGPSGVVFAES